MTLGALLKRLAKGVHPVTGQALPVNSVVHEPVIIRALYSIADEIGDVDIRKAKKSISERRAENIEKGKPANAHLPWSDDAFNALATEFEAGRNISELADSFERSRLAIAIQLEKAGLISEEKVDTYRASPVS